MITSDMIPDEVVNAASKAYELYIYDSVSDEGMRVAIARALNAWPAIKICYFLPQGRTITLPFPNVSKYPRKEGDK